MAADPFTLLQNDHRYVARVLKALAESEPGGERDALVEEVTQAFEAHAEFEETAIYPIVVEVMGQDTETEAEVEHGLAREGLARLAQLAAAPGFGAAVEMLEAGITHHVDEEENEIFPALRKALDDDTKARLSSELARLEVEGGAPADRSAVGEQG